MLENLKRQIEIIKKLIRMYQLLWAIKKNEPKPSEFAIRKAIADICFANKIDSELALRVAKCESGLDPFAINFNDSKSIDRGLFQINDYWHAYMSDEDCFNYQKSIEFFCRSLKAGHLDWWNASRPCWNK